MSRLPMPITFLCVLLSLSNFGGGGVPVVDGFDLKEPENPYRSFFARLVVTFKGQSEPITCGGAVIHPYWVLTAAHCVANATTVDVIVGNFVSITGDRIPVVGVKAFWPEDFNETNPYNNDMGLVLMKEPADEGSVLPICYEEFPRRTFLSTVGMGRRSDDTSNAVHLVETHMFESMFWTQFLRVFNLRDDLFQAKLPKDRKECFIESGGPLIAMNKDDYEAICVYGIASRFHLRTKGECLNLEFYSSVPDLHPWVENVIMS